MIRERGGRREKFCCSVQNSFVTQRVVRIVECERRRKRKGGSGLLRIFWIELSVCCAVLGIVPTVLVKFSLVPVDSFAGNLLSSNPFTVIHPIHCRPARSLFDIFSLPTLQYLSGRPSPFFEPFPLPPTEPDLSSQASKQLPSFSFHPRQFLYFIALRSRYLTSPPHPLPFPKANTSFLTR